MIRPLPKPIAFQDLSIGDRFYASPDSDDWWEKIREDRDRNAKGQSGLMIRIQPLRIVYFYPLETMYRK